MREDGARCGYYEIIERRNVSETIHKKPYEHPSRDAHTAPHCCYTCSGERIAVRPKLMESGSSGMSVVGLLDIPLDMERLWVLGL